MRVLFVEDHSEVRELITELLEEEEGLTVVACETAEIAEAEFDKGGFDLVLTDISLPVMSGTTLARRLLARHPDMWLVFLSGYPMSGLESWGPHVRTMLKPFDPEELHALLEEVRAGR